MMVPVVLGYGLGLRIQPAVLALLVRLFCMLDGLVESHRVMKVETVGDCCKY